MYVAAGKKKSTLCIQGLLQKISLVANRLHSIRLTPPISASFTLRKRNLATRDAGKESSPDEIFTATFPVKTVPVCCIPHTFALPPCLEFVARVRTLDVHATADPDPETLFQDE